VVVGAQTLFSVVNFTWTDDWEDKQITRITSRSGSRRTQGEFTWKSDLLIERHVGIQAASHPRHLNPTAIGRIFPRLRGIEIRARVRIELRRRLSELDAIELANGILSVTANEDPFHPAAIAVERQLKKVRALVAVADRMFFVVPRKQIGGSEDVIETLAVSIPVKKHHPAGGRRVPEDFRVALGMSQHGIFLIMLPRPPAIQAVGNAVGAIVIARPEGDQGRMVRACAQARGVRVINDAGAGLHAGVQLFLPESGLQFGPMHEVFANSVNPTFIPALREQVIFTFVVNQPVEIIEPAFLPHAGMRAVHGPLARGKMELRAKHFLIFDQTGNAPLRLRGAPAYGRDG
jgi:hypothetical protein